MMLKFRAKKLTTEIEATAKTAAMAITTRLPRFGVRPRISR